MKEIKIFEREDIFKKYNEMDNPFVIMTIPIKVTNIVNYAKKNKHFYAAMGYLIGKTVNDIENFRYRYVDEKYYLCDRVSVSYTEKVGNKIGFFECDSFNFNDYIKEYDLNKEKLIKSEYVSEVRNDVIWVSCVPWFSFSGLISPHDKKIMIPQFIQDRYVFKDREYFCNLMLSIHHGFADGYHIAKFIEKLNDNIDNFK